MLDVSPQKSKVMGRGGARPNAGRKKLDETAYRDKIAVLVRLDKEIVAKIDASGQSRNRYIELLVRDYFEKKATE